jgi:hypothetical protein
VLIGGAIVGLISAGLLVPRPGARFSLVITGLLLITLGSAALVPPKARAVAFPLALATTLCGLLTLWSVFGELPEL